MSVLFIIEWGAFLVGIVPMMGIHLRFREEIKETEVAILLYFKQLSFGMSVACQWLLIFIFMKSTLPYSKYLMIALLQLVIFTGNAQNLLSNPGFSSLGANWNYNGNLVEVNTASVYGGRGSNPCAEIDIEVGLSQRVVVVPGNYYQFTIKGSRRTDFFANTPASVSMRINIRGTATGTNYINKTKTYTNTTFAYTNDVSSFYIPRTSAETFVVISITAVNNNTTTGVIVDDLVLLQVSATTFLPVSFGNFSGAVQNNKVSLKFTTEQEINNDRFEIERSSNGVDFKTIATLKGTNSLVPQQYTATDAPGTSGSFQYRIRQIDLDGKVSFSKTIVVRLVSSSEDVKVFPTVVASQINYAISLSEACNINITVFDAQGRTYFQQQQKVGAGSQQQSVNTSTLSKGMYYIQIKDDQGSIKHTQAFMKA